MIRRIALASIVAALSLLDLGPAEASSARVTRGDAEAVFQAFGYAGFLHRVRAGVGPQDTGVVNGAPSDSELQTAIRPFSGLVWDGRHYCELDWHVILTADFEPGLSYREAKEIIDQIGKTYFLDGNQLATTQTAIKRVFVPSGGEGYYANFGIVMPPDALAVGSHTLVMVETGPFAGTDQITFFIDPEGTGACL